MSKIFAISDIHGCYDELMALMKKLPLNPIKDKMVFLGDYIDRGHQSMQVVKQLIKWDKKYPHWEFLYGNHEDLMLDALVYKGRIYHSYDLWYGQGGKETAKSYFRKNMNKYDMAISQPKDHIKWKHLDWLRKRPIYHETEKYFFVHAAVLPNITLAEFKHHIDNNEAPVRGAAIWAREDFINCKYDWGKKIIFGHTANSSNRKWGKPFEPIVMENKIGIDTAVCPGRCNKLTAVELPIEKFYFQEYIWKNKI